MNDKIRSDAKGIIEARFVAIADKSLTFDLQREIEMGVDMAHLCGALTLDEQRHYKERLMRAVENDRQQWADDNRRA